jgi:tetratricopeptide (TPR) repeat protein
VNTPATLTEALTASAAELRLLLVTPSPVNDPSRLQPEAELREIYGALDQLRVSVDVIRLNPPTIDNMAFALATGRFGIVHIACHGNGDGIDLEEEDGTAAQLSAERLVDLFHGHGPCLLVLSGCSTEKIGDQLALSEPDITTLSVGGGISRRSALRAVSNIYSLLLTGRSSQRVAEDVTALVRRLGERDESIRARGRSSREPLFNVSIGDGRPGYYACSPPTNVPPRRMPIFDREDEILLLHSALFDEDAPYVGLVGITGNGKTTLLQAVVNRYGWRFTDGIGYFSLRADLSLTALAEVFGWNESGAEMKTQDLLSRLSAGRYLLIFDDAEDASPSAIREISLLLSDWDTSLGGRAILVLHTRRAEFRDIIGNCWITIRELPPQASRELMESRLGSRESARRTLGDDIAAVPELCFGHPKTIESTASLLQLGQRWPELKGDLRRLSGQGPLAVNDEMMGRIIERLENARPGVAELLDTWAVFEDRCREETWRAVATADNADPGDSKRVLDTALADLHGATLIDRFDANNEPCCLMHPLLVSHLRRRHEALSAEKLRRLVRSQLSEQQQLATVHRYPVEESGNVRRALRLAEDHGLVREIVAYCESVAGEQSLPLVKQGPWILARDLLDLGVRAAAGYGDSRAEVRFLLVRGIVEYRLAEFTAALEAYRKAGQLARRIDDAHSLLSAMWGSGRILYRMGDFDGAEQTYLEAKSVVGKAEALIIADIDHELAKVYYRKKQYGLAKELFAHVLGIRRSAGSHQQLARSLHELARIEHITQDYGRAHSLYMEALRLERQDDNPVTEQATLFQLGRLALDQGDTEAAARWFDESRKISQRLDDRVWLVHANFGQALLQWARGDHGRAMTIAQKTIDDCRRLNIGLVREIQEWLESIGVPSTEGDA